MPRRHPLPPWTWSLAAVLMLLAVNAAITPAMFESGALLDILSRASIIVLAATGMTLVVATGGVDLSVGAVVAVAAAACAVTLDAGHPGAVAIAVAIAAALGAGAFNGLLVAAFSVQPIVATLVLMVAGRGVAQLITSGQIITFDDPVLSFIDGGTLAGIPCPALLAGLAIVLVWLGGRRTPIGLYLEAVGDNPSAARLAGVRTRTVTALAYILSGLCAGVAGLIAAADINAADANNAGLYLELDAILAVVLGGTALAGGRFTLVGAALGAVFIQLLSSTLLYHDVNPNATLVVKGVIVVAICLMLSERVRSMRVNRKRPA